MLPFISLQCREFHSYAKSDRAFQSFHLNVRINYSNALRTLSLTQQCRSFSTLHIVS